VLVAQQAALVLLHQQELGAAIAGLAAGGQFGVALLGHGLKHQAGALAPLHAGEGGHAGAGLGQAAAMDAEPPGADQQRGDGHAKGGDPGADTKHPATPIS